MDGQALIHTTSHAGVPKKSSHYTCIQYPEYQMEKNLNENIYWNKHFRYYHLFAGRLEYEQK